MIALYWKVAKYLTNFLKVYNIECCFFLQSFQMKYSCFRCKACKVSHKLFRIQDTVFNNFVLGVYFWQSKIV